MMARFLEKLLIAMVRLLAGAYGCWQGCEQSRDQRIYVANHSSHLDAVLLLSAIPEGLRRQTRPVAAAEYWNTGPLRRYLIHDIFHAVLIERTGGPLNPLEPAARALREGDSLIVFPEGTRGPGTALQPLKPGIFHLATWFPKIEIVPVWIDNSHRILPKGFAIPVPRRCSLTFGTPLRLKAGQKQAEFLEAVREALEALRPC